ncbi:hypothetical protein [Streptomyces glaucescens]|uniref:DNA-binding protein n=1 Tax=Streptomyces glaucescens TaxID=1907 RepID=A0A089WXU5_STRGA|nr:hypothetical protein [Streptomyces glaucescens]AIR96242.1 hypothetical protein SGLAU_01070 [Streptomyces glaucescens]
MTTDDTVTHDGSAHGGTRHDRPAHHGPRYDETTAAALLDAGAILPPGSRDHEDADVLTVRTYTHPALDERTVVRLVPGTLGEAEDLAMDFLGLVRDARTHEVGQVRRETLGFPAWALVNDPANGHHALALVKDVERLARQAKSRPGTAKEGFEELGERLGRAVPHFLPTFYEQAARVFLQHENTTYAAAFFGKARDAERVHALGVDEERQRAVFLEFAFAGALTVKALKEHVKDLAARLSPAEAWAQYRQLTVERCAAGMPPYASLPQDARALIKAAGLDRVTEECALVADLLASPAAVRAPATFWNTYRATLVVLAGQRPAVRARLLEIMPAGLGRSTEDDEFWLALLADTGADGLLTGDRGSAEEADPADGSGTADGTDAADWLSRWALFRKHGATHSGRSSATLALVRRMAPRLRAQGRPVDLFTGRWHAGADLDLLDLCVAESIPLAWPPAHDTVHLPLGQWLQETRPGRRDLTALAADPSGRRLLYAAVGNLTGHGLGPALLEGLAGHPVLSDVLREWLDDAAAELSAAAALPAARAALEKLRPFRAVAARISPQAVARAAAVDVAPLLGRTLRAGIPDELGWPALDEALRRLDAETRADRDDTLGVHEAWPALILSRRHKAIVVGPQEILLEHDLRLPAELDRWQRPLFRYTDGELLVMWWHDGKQYGYWSARPSEVFALGGERIPRWYGGRDAGGTSIPLPGGGRATGGRTLHAGDTDLPPTRPVLGDGTSYWRQGRQGRQHVWLEYDPATGTHARASLPAFLRSGIREGATLRQQHCSVLPLQPGLEHSPFGTDGIVLGRWVRAEGEGDEARVTVGTPDGRTATLPTAPGRTSGVPVGALRLPGGAEPVVVAGHRQITLYTADGDGGPLELGRVTPLERGGEFAAGTRLVPPVDFWHALRPRDENASALLRALSDEQADDVLRAGAQALAERQAEVAAAAARAKADAAAAGTAAGTGHAAAGGAGHVTGDATGQPAVPSADEVLRETVARCLPALTEPHVLTGVAGLARGVLRLAESIAAFVAPPAERQATDAERTRGMFAGYRPENGDDQTLREAVDGLANLHGWWGGEQRWSALRQIRAVNHVLSGNPAGGRPLPGSARLTGPAGGWHSDEHTLPGIGLVWPSVLGLLRPLAYRAASATMTHTHRQALLLLFDAITEGPLAAPGGALREIVLSEPHTRQERTGQVLRRDGRTVVVLGSQTVDHREGRVHWLALDHDPSGAFGAVAHFTLERETAYPPVFPADALAAVTGLIREKGAAPWQPEAPAALCAATRDGLGPVQAALLLAGKPPQLTDEVIAATGLKPRQKQLGDALLGWLGPGDRAALVGALLPDDPAGLWTTGPDTEAAGRVWAGRLAGVVRLPEDLAAEQSLAGLPTGTAEEVLNPHRTPWISRTTVQRPGKDGELVPDDPRALPGRYDLSRAVAALAGLAYSLPYGHPLRAVLPGALAALRRRVADPGLLLDLDLAWTEKGSPAAAELRKAYGMPATGGADAQGLTAVGEALALRPWYGDQETVLVRPAALTGADDPVFGLVEGLVGPARGHGMRALRTILGEDLARAVAAGTDPEGPTGYAQDPSLSAPGLVAEVAQAHGLGADAAVLYLQLLALPDPTDRNCARWTGWKPARTKKARAELAATGLVVEARRARAGRTLFLPCGWLDLKAPALPVEVWKQGLYPVGTHARAVPSVPVPELFGRAWDRVRAGDAPAYEELTTRATRKGRRR